MNPPSGQNLDQGILLSNLPGRERWPVEMDPHPEHFHRVLCNYTRGLVARTLEGIAGRCIIWDVKTYMLCVCIWEGGDPAERISVIK